MNRVGRRHGYLWFGAAALSLAACAGSPPPFELGRVASPFAMTTPGAAAPVVPSVTATEAMPANPVQRGRAAHRNFGGLGGAWIPWCALELNERPVSQGAGTPPGSVDTGDGWAVRAGFTQDDFGTDVVFATTKHDDTNGPAEMTMYQLYMDFVQGQELWSGPVSAWIAAGLGVGIVRFDWDSTYKTENSSMWQAEGIFALRVGRHVSLEARAMGFLAAYPTRTAGVGAMGMLGGEITF